MERDEKMKGEDLIDFVEDIFTQGDPRYRDQFNLKLVAQFVELEAIKIKKGKISKGKLTKTDLKKI